MTYTFGKHERLCCKRMIDRLYAEGHRIHAFPYSLQWRFESLDQPCQTMIVAPKRKFKHAVDRNRVKRLTRECWRLRKQILYHYLQSHGLSITLALVYVHHEQLSYNSLGNKMDKMMEALVADIEKHRPR